MCQCWFIDYNNYITLIWDIDGEGGVCENYVFLVQFCCERTYGHFKKYVPGTSLVAQWLRICLPMQGTRVRALVWEDPTCRSATKPVCHNY